MPIPLDYERPTPPPPRRPGAARYWLWYYGGPRYLLVSGAFGAIALAVGAVEANPIVGVLAAAITFITAVRLRPVRRVW